MLPRRLFAHVAGEFAQRDIVVPIRIGLSPQSPQQIVGEQTVAMPAVFQPLLQLLAADQSNLVLSLNPQLRYSGLGVGFGGGDETVEDEQDLFSLEFGEGRLHIFERVEVPSRGMAVVGDQENVAEWRDPGLNTRRSQPLARLYAMAASWTALRRDPLGLLWNPGAMGYSRAAGRRGTENNWMHRAGRRCAYRDRHWPL